MTLAAYNGHEALTFTDYLDLGTGRTLHAEPGGVYDITPAGGRVVAEVPSPWFRLVAREPYVPRMLVREPAESSDKEPAGEPDEPAGDLAPDEDPEAEAPGEF